MVNNKQKQFSYALLNVFFALFLILVINTLYLYKFSDVPDLCTDLGGTVNSAALVQHLNTMIFGSILAVVATSGICFAFVVFLTHRFYGPLVPIHRHIEELKKGNFTSRLKVRKKDELQELCDQLNDLSEELQKNYVRR